MLIQTETFQVNPDSSYSTSQALQFIPQAHILERQSEDGVFYQLACSH